MNELLKDLLVVGGEIRMKSVTETASVEVGGKFTMQRGNFIQEFSYWARTYDKFSNFAHVDDYESEDRDAKLGDLPIDNLNKFIQSLHDSGLDTLAKGVGFTSEEVRQAMYEHIQQHKTFKAVYGKRAELWNLLTQEEQQTEMLVYVAKNYDTCGDYYKKQCGVVVLDEEGNVIKDAIPTREQINEEFMNLITN